MSTPVSAPNYQHVFRLLLGLHLLLTSEGSVVEYSASFAASRRGSPHPLGSSYSTAWTATPDQLAQVAASLAQVCRTRQPDALLLPAFRLPTGPVAPQRLTHTPLLGANGELEYVLQAFESVADPVAAAPESVGQLPTREPATDEGPAAADTLLMRLQTLFMQVPAAIASLTGPEHVFQLVNPEYQQLVGNRVLLGQPIAKALPEVQGQGYFSLLDQVYRTGNPYYGQEMVAHVDRTGTGSLATCYFNFVCQAARNAAGVVEGVLIFAFEVTEQVVARQQAEQRKHELDVRNEELYAANAEFHTSNAALFSAQQRLQTLNQELEARVLRRTKAQDVAQQEVERQRNRLERFFMQSPAAICIFNGPRLVFELVNPEYQRLYPGRELLGKPLLEALPELADHMVWHTLQQVYQTGVTHEKQAVLVKLARTAGAPPENRYFNYVQQARFDAQGVVDGVMVFAYNVTEQMQARQQEQETARAFETLTNAIPHLIWTTTPTGFADYYNQQWYEYTGSTLAESQNRGWTVLLHPEDALAVLQQWEAALQSGQAYQIEARLRNATGEYRWFLIRAQPFRDARGTITKWFGANTDIHDQKRLAQSIVESEQYFRLMADNIPAMLWVTRLDGQCVYLNQQWYEYTGQTEEEGLGFGWTDAIHPAESAQVGQAFRDANERQVPYKGVFRLKAKSGAYRWVVDTGQPKFNKNGVFEGFVGSVTDIHERRMAELALRFAGQKLATTNKELRAANEQSRRTNTELAEMNAQLTRTNQDLDNFVYTASHDLRQPVSNMAGVFEELKRNATFHDPQAEQLVEMFEGAMHQINTTIQGLTEVVQVERQHEHLPPEPVDLLVLTQGAIQSMQNQASALHADFQLDFAVPTIRFTRLNLQSILYNLLSNSLKYAHPDRPPVVRVASTRQPDGTVVLEVHDNGLGLDLARHGHDLFKMFHRFHDHVGGSGLGLHLVNRIVQQAGGRIEVDSTLGVGTTFRLHLPEAE